MKGRSAPAQNHSPPYGPLPPSARARLQAPRRPPPCTPAPGVSETATRERSNRAESLPAVRTSPAFSPSAAEQPRAPLQEPPPCTPAPDVSETATRERSNRAESLPAIRTSPASARARHRPPDRRRALQRQALAKPQPGSDPTVQNHSPPYGPLPPSARARRNSPGAATGTAPSACCPGCWAAPARGPGTPPRLRRATAATPRTRGLPLLARRTAGSRRRRRSPSRT